MSRFDGMSHAEIQNLLPDYAANELQEHERLFVEQHLRQCVPCQRALAEIQHVRTLLRSLFAETAPATPDPIGTSVLTENVMAHLAPSPPESALFPYWHEDEEGSLEKENAPIVAQPRPLFASTDVMREDDSTAPSLNRHDAAIHNKTYERIDDRESASKKGKSMQIITEQPKTTIRIIRSMGILAAVLVGVIIAGSLTIVLATLPKGGPVDNKPTPPVSITPTVEPTRPIKKVDGIYYVNASMIFKLSLDGTEQIWQTEVPGLYRDMIAVTDDAIYALAWSEQSGEPATLHKYGVDDGKLVWSIQFQGSDPGKSTIGYVSLMATKNAVYLHNEYGVWALSHEDGHILWEYSSGVQIVNAQPAKMVEVDGVLYVTTMNVFYAVNVETGNEAWKRILKEGTQLGPVTVANGYVYAAGGNFFERTPAHVYSFRTDGYPGPTSPPIEQEHQLSLVVVQNKIFATSRNSSNVYVLDARGGSLLWTTPLEGKGHHIIVGNDVVYVQEVQENVEPGKTPTARIVALSAKENKVLWRSEQLTGNSIVAPFGELSVRGDTIYVHTSTPDIAPLETFTVRVYGVRIKDGSIAWVHES